MPTKGYRFNQRAVMAAKGERAVTAYYNEHDSFAAAWLRELIKDGHIAPGDVDERDIQDVCPDELAAYTQCHFFAGIGGWSYALRLAGWPDDRPIWTGSPPCQPFSAAGKGGGFADERHLWPAWFWLIRQCQPSAIFGEQVSSKAGLEWWDVVAADLEAQGYGVGAFDISAAGAGAFHIRQRIYWVADATKPGRDARRRASEAGHQSEAEQRPGRLRINGVALGDTEQRRRRRQSRRRAEHQPADTIWSDAIWLQCTDGKARPTKPGLQFVVDGLSRTMGDLWGQSFPKTEKGIVNYAKTTKNDTKEILQEMQEIAQAEEIQREARGLFGIHAERVLQFALCQLARQVGQKQEGLQQGISKKQEITMRKLRKSSGEHTATSCASSKSQLEGQQRRKLYDFVYELSHEASQQRDAIATIISLNGHPLSSGFPNRVGTLRGAGNAIVPQIAAEFIRAYMEI